MGAGLIKVEKSEEQVVRVYIALHLTNYRRECLTILQSIATIAHDVSLTTVCCCLHIDSI